MNFDWIISPLTIYGVLATGGAAALHLVVSTRIEMRRQQKRHLTEGQSLREAIASLQGKVEQFSEEAKRDMLPPVACNPFKGLNVHKRTEALRMYRLGSDRDTVAAALDLPSADVALLEKVYHLLSLDVAAWAPRGIAVDLPRVSLQNNADYPDA